MNTCPECFGKAAKSGKLETCPPCEFRESCAFCAADDGSSCDRRLGHVSYDRYAYSREAAAPAVEPAAEPAPAPASGDAETLRVMEFLMDLDNYTAELLHEVLYGGCSTTSDLAKKFGVSRQAIHRKIIDCCTLHPELRQLFITRLYRCRRILSDSDRLKKLKGRRENPDQMELEFE